MRRLLVLLFVGGVWACNSAPAPCNDHPDCVVGLCVNGGCIDDAPPIPEPEPTPDATPDAAPEPDGRVDMGERDAVIEMDAAPGCEGINLSVSLPPDVGPLRRNEPVLLSVTVADGAAITYESSAGGAFVEEPGGARWIARDEVIWPWRTGTIELTVRAELDDCRVSRVVTVTLLGDLLIADTSSGQLVAVGSNGTVFGQWRLIDDTGITTMVQLPDGGFVVGVRGPLIGGVHPEPEIVRLDANGQEIGRFATTSVADGSQLFTRGPTAMYVVGDEIMAVSGHDPVVHWFGFDGQHLRTQPTDDTRATGLAPWGETIAIALNGDSRIYTPDGADLRAVGGVDRVVEGLHPLRDGAVLVVSDSSEDRLDRLEADGRITAVPALPPGFGLSHLIPFGDGYVGLSQINSRLYLFGPDLATDDDAVLANVNAFNVRRVLWLNR